MQAYHGRCRDKMFTLVELLVVIAIISILAALLMPALERARDQALSAACMNNQKQCGTMFAMYSNDFDGCIPGNWASGAYGYSWARFYSANTGSTYFAFSTMKDGTGATGYYSGTVRCPAATNRTDTIFHINCDSYGMMELRAEFERGSYQAFIVPNFGSIYQKAPDGVQFYIVDKHMKNPSNFIALADSTHGGASELNTNGWLFYTRGFNWSGSIKIMGTTGTFAAITRHIERANTLLYDGHVGAQTAYDLGNGPFKFRAVALNDYSVITF